jgi:hypothetical protein
MGFNNIVGGRRKKRGYRFRIWSKCGEEWYKMVQNQISDFKKLHTHVKLILFICCKLVVFNFIGGRRGFEKSLQKSPNEFIWRNSLNQYVIQI